MSSARSRKSRSRVELADPYCAKRLQPREAQYFRAAGILPLLSGSPHRCGGKPVYLAGREFRKRKLRWCFLGGKRLRRAPEEAGASESGHNAVYIIPADVRGTAEETAWREFDEESGQLGGGGVRRAFFDDVGTDRVRVLWLAESKYALFLWRPAPAVAGRLWELPSRYAALSPEERPADADMESLHWVPLHCLLLPRRGAVDDLGDQLQGLAVSGPGASPAGQGNASSPPAHSESSSPRASSPTTGALSGTAEATPPSAERAPWRTPGWRSASAPSPSSAATGSTSFTASPVSGAAGSPSSHPRMQWRDIAGEGARNTVAWFLVRELKHPTVQTAIRSFAEPP